MNPIHLISLCEGQPQVWSRGTEQHAVHLLCDISPWLRAWPLAAVHVAFERPDGQKYDHAFTLEGQTVHIPLLLADTAVPGLCKCAVTLRTQDAQANTCVYCGYVTQGVDSLGEAPDDVQQGVIEQTRQILAQSVLESAQAAASAESSAGTAASSAAQSALDAARVQAIVSGNAAYTKAESDAAFSPAIAETAQGHSISLQDHAPLPPRALSLFGTADSAFAGPVQVDIALCGKNLLPPVMTDQSYYGMTLTANDDGSATLNGTASYTTVWKWAFSPAIPEGTYTLSCNNEKLTEGSVIFMVNTVSGTPFTVYPGVSGSTRTFTSTEPISGIQFTIMAGGTADHVTVRPQLEKGSTATAYAPYCASCASLMLAQAPGALPTAAGGSYTDKSSGWLADEVDLTAGEYVQRLARAVFDGSTAPVRAGSGNAFYIALPAPACDTTYEEAQTPYLSCDALPVLPRKQVAESAEGIALSSGNVILRVNNVTTPEEMIAFLQASPVTVLYRPRESMALRTALPAESIASVLALRLPAGPAHIFNSASLFQSLTYTADTKAYIDNRIAALSAAMLQL